MLYIIIVWLNINCLSSKNLVKSIIYTTAFASLVIIKILNSNAFIIVKIIDERWYFVIVRFKIFQHWVNIIVWKL